MTSKSDKEHMDEHVVEYWRKHYLNTVVSLGGLCSLCGNRGVIDTRGVKSPAGVESGRLNYCICPNGQSLRDQGGDLGWWLRNG